jgi:hypothetical protein
MTTLAQFLSETSAESADTRADLEEISRAPVIDISNVYHQFEREVFPTDAGLDFSAAFRRCIPPFETQFVERASHGGRLGHMVSRDGAPGDLMRISVDNGWGLRPDGVLLRSPYWFEVLLASDGTVQTATVDPKVAAMGATEFAVMMFRFCAPLFAFRTMHAKGVRLVERNAPRHECQRAVKSGRPALLRYHVIQIDKTARGSATHGRTEIERALHIVRGHFADYTNGPGLFGKHKVEVFVPEHIRGDPRRGVVLADYRL